MLRCRVWLVQSDVMTARDVETWFKTIPADVQQLLLAADPVDDEEPPIFVVPKEVIDALPTEHTQGKWFVQKRAGMAGGPIEAETWYAVGRLAELLTRRRKS